MLIQDNTIPDLEERILVELKRINCRPHQKLLSERKLAEIFKVPRSRVHLAVLELIKKGFLYSKHGNGTFVAKAPTDIISSNKNNKKIKYPKNESSVEEPSFLPVDYLKTLKVLISIKSVSWQAEKWKELFRLFEEKYPYMKLSPVFTDTANSEDLKDYDSAIITPPDIYSKHNVKVSCLERKWFSVKDKELLDGIFKTGMIEGILRGIPLMRVPPTISVNVDLATAKDIDIDSIDSPYSMLKAAFEAEEENKSEIRGYMYLGPYFQAALYGVEFQRTADKFLFDEDRLCLFLEETRKCFRRHFCELPGEKLIKMFMEGKYIFFPHFSSVCRRISASPFTFEFIPPPLLEGGFNCEGFFIGSVNPESSMFEESLLFLNFLLEKDTQTYITELFPEFLSVRKDVFNTRRGKIRGVNTAFDIRSAYTQCDPVLFNDYGKVLFAETSKFFMGHQNMNDTIKRLRSPLMRGNSFKDALK